MQNNIRLGIWLMCATTFVFAVQDGISRHLAAEYNVFMIVMVRYWFFAAFVIAIAIRTQGSIKKAAATTQPILQITRGLLLATEICVMVFAFVKLGLVESHAIFACYPLLIAALSGPILGETVGWRRWIAIAIGFVGVLVILQPGFGVFSPFAVIPLTSAIMFAVYGLLTRYAARRDTAATSFFWTGVVGAVGMTCVGVWFWETMSSPDWIWMSALCVTRRDGAFFAYQNIRSRRSVSRAAICLSAIGVCHCNRHERLWREDRHQCGHWSLHCCGRRIVHAVAHTGCYPPGRLIGRMPFGPLGAAGDCVAGAAKSGRTTGSAAGVVFKDVGRRFGRMTGFTPDQ